MPENGERNGVCAERLRTTGSVSCLVSPGAFGIVPGIQPIPCFRSQEHSCSGMPYITPSNSRWKTLIAHLSFKNHVCFQGERMSWICRHQVIQISRFVCRTHKTGSFNLAVESNLALIENYMELCFGSHRQAMTCLGLLLNHGIGSY